ncbi:hypothetical protein [Janibacter corallicola]|uniref:hypothetical protein n=1 Tax=Janibacter corallicola TaxID=415212 RepID=UPI0009FE3F52|nr:hypothetical protein [Janibacter corallicola]
MRVRTGIVALCVLLAGCSGGGGQSGESATDTATSTGHSRGASPAPTTGAEGDRFPSTTDPLPSDLTRDLRRVLDRHEELEASVSVVPVGGDEPRTVGEAPTLVAWSTIKVPLALAIERAGLGEKAAADVEAAITASDNEAAADLWERLGSGRKASDATEAQLRRGGDTRTEVPPEVTAPGFSPFGQSRWRLADQATFTASLPCLAGSTTVTSAMSRVLPGQSWGLGTIEGARFKGGWGPTPEGYVVRQLGIVPGTKGDTAIALQVRGGDHAADTAVADELAVVLREHSGQLPTGSC